MTPKPHSTFGLDYYWNVETRTGTDSVLCPDLLRLSDLGEADNWRGYLVRGFFRLLGWLTGI